MVKGVVSLIVLLFVAIASLIFILLVEDIKRTRIRQNPNHDPHPNPNPNRNVNPNPELNLPEVIRYYVSRDGVPEEYINDDLSSENAIGYELYSQDNNDLYHFHSRLPNSIPKDVFDILPDGYDMVYFGVDGYMHTHNQENINNYEPAGNELCGYNEELNRYILLR